MDPGTVHSMLYAPPTPFGVPWKSHHCANGAQHELWSPSHTDLQWAWSALILSHHQFPQFQIILSGLLALPQPHRIFEGYQESWGKLRKKHEFHPLPAADGKCHLHALLFHFSLWGRLKWCWRRLLRVPWTARRSSQSILEISPAYSFEGLMLKLKLQYFGHLMRRTDSLEKTLMLGKIEGGRRRG